MRERSAHIGKSRWWPEWRRPVLPMMFAGVMLVGLVAPGWGQETGRWRLERVIEAARRNYPAVRIARAEAAGAVAGIEVARTGYLPRTELDWQQTRGTRNNIFGPFFPQSAINPISGPILDGSSLTESVWGSGGGLLVSWELFDFGRRRAEVGVAERIGDEARRRAELTELEAATMAADRFLQAVAAEQAVRSASAAVERMESFAKAVGTLVENELRPGADGSRVAVELAAVRNSLIQARQQAALARVELAEAIGQGGEVIEIEAGDLLAGNPPPGLPTALNTLTVQHPRLRRQEAALETVNARKRLLERSLMPRVSWQTTFFARGTGARIDGRRLGNRGFYPDTANWMTGLTITFAPSDLFRIRAGQRQEAENLAAEEARLDQTRQQLKTEEARAQALAAAATAWTENAPRQLEAARLTELRVRKRYDAELGTVIEVAEAQRLLAQAEVEQALARLAVWRARLAESRARGDLAPFLSLLGKGGSN